MEKIDSFIKIGNNIDINYTEYFIMPYYPPEALIYIKMSKDDIQWFNNSLKNMTGFKRINTSLRKLYSSSKYNGYNITLIGFISLKKKVKTFVIIDLLLDDEITKKIQSKKYSIRLDNIRNRFGFSQNTNIKNIMPVFSQKINSIDDTIYSNLIESNSWEGFIYYKDKPYNYIKEENSLIFDKKWEIMNGIVTGISSADDGTINEIFVTSNKNIIVKIKDGLNSLNKIPAEKRDELIFNKPILYKKCELQNKEKNIILTKFLKFE